MDKKLKPNCLVHIEVTIGNIKKRNGRAEETAAKQELFSDDTSMIRKQFSEFLLDIGTGKESSSETGKIKPPKNFANVFVL